MAARTDVVPQFLNGRKLRDYQCESLKWMMANFRIQKNCILGDEMVRSQCLSAFSSISMHVFSSYLCCSFPVWLQHVQHVIPMVLPSLDLFVCILLQSGLPLLILMGSHGSCNHI